jgi:surface protein
MHHLLGAVTSPALFVLAFFAFFVAPSAAQGTAMVIQITMLQNNAELCLPLIAPLRLTVTWGDGSFPQNFTGTSKFCSLGFVSPGIAHTYATAGNYTIRLDRDGSAGPIWLTGFGIDFIMEYWSIPAVKQTLQLTAVVSFGDLGIVSLKSAFSGCDSLVSVPQTLPSTVKSLEYTFARSSFNSANVSTWNTAGVTTFANTFNGAANFNQPLNNWNVSGASSLVNLFAGASSFNRGLSSWKFADGAALPSMFSLATSFNRPLDMWDVSRISNMASMFYGASSFNQPLNSWDVSRVTSFLSFFDGASSFNQPLNNWNVARYDARRKNLWVSRSFFLTSVEIIIAVAEIFGGCSAQQQRSINLCHRGTLLFPELLPWIPCFNSLPISIKTSNLGVYRTSSLSPLALLMIPP